MVTVARGRADHRSRALHGIARQPRRDDGTSGHPRPPPRRALGPRVDGQRLHLTFAVLLLTAAPSASVFGRRRTFMTGVAIFTTASALAAIAPSIGFLIAARALQGAGGAMIMPLSLTLLSAAVRPNVATPRSASGERSVARPSLWGLSSVAPSRPAGRGTTSSGSTCRLASFSCPWRGGNWPSHVGPEPSGRPGSTPRQWRPPRVVLGLVRGTPVVGPVRACSPPS